MKILRFEKRIGEILNFLKINDDRTGKITKEIKTNELNISRIDFFLKRAVILVEQVKDIGIKIQITTTLTCIKQNIKKSYALLNEANRIDPYNIEVLLHLARVQSKLNPNNPLKMQKILYRIQSLLDTPRNDTDKFHLVSNKFFNSRI